MDTAGCSSRQAPSLRATWCFSDLFVRIFVLGEYCQGPLNFVRTANKPKHILRRYHRSLCSRTVLVLELVMRLLRGLSGELVGRDLTARPVSNGGGKHSACALECTKYLRLKSCRYSVLCCRVLSNASAQTSFPAFTRGLRGWRGRALIHHAADRSARAAGALRAGPFRGPALELLPGALRAGRFPSPVTNRSL